MPTHYEQFCDLVADAVTLRIRRRAVSRKLGKPTLVAAVLLREADGRVRAEAGLLAEWAS